MLRGDIGSLISKSRSDSGLTQDQFGRKYNVSGPAIFKFEKGYVRPSLDLWLQIAKDTGVDERTAVLLWARAKLPRKYQSLIDVDSPVKEPDPKAKGKKNEPIDDPEEARKAILADRTAPKGLKRLLKDEELWALYKPSGFELHTLSTLFNELGDGSKASYREALRLVREFGGA